MVETGHRDGLEAEVANGPWDAVIDHSYLGQWAEAVLRHSPIGDHCECEPVGGTAPL